MRAGAIDAAAEIKTAMLVLSMECKTKPRAGVSCFLCWMHAVLQSSAVSSRFFIWGRREPDHIDVSRWSPKSSEEYPSRGEIEISGPKWRCPS
jgi:hypothetical protein